MNIFDTIKISGQDFLRCRECGSIIEKLPVWEKKHIKFHTEMNKLERVMPPVTIGRPWYESIR